MLDLGKTIGRLARAALLILAAGSLGPAHATSTYTYGENEYVVVAGGMAPDHQHAIAAHGSGDYGSDNFHLYLLAEPGGKVIGPLEEVEGFDTGPGSYSAVWSPDSRYVGVLYRGDRHVVALNLYRIERGRAFPITGALPLSAVSASADNLDVRSRHLELTWQGDKRFLLKEESTLKRDASALSGKLAGFHAPGSGNGRLRSLFRRGRVRDGARRQIPNRRPQAGGSRALSAG
jgi:hypothetical protein